MMHAGATIACGLGRQAFASSAAKTILRGVVFDMDGTLTVPCIDFKEMYRRVGSETTDILHEIESWPPERQERAYKIITEMEMEAKANLKIMPGLITRNVKTSVDYFHTQFGLPAFSPALSREFRPYKPDPSPLLHICSTWGIPPHEVLMVGDSAKDDIICGRRAGAATILLDESDRYSQEELVGEQEPHFVVKSLKEMESLLRDNFDLLPAEV
eukprot:jgi/Mesen1/8941/ME000552S08446